MPKNKGKQRRKTSKDVNSTTAPKTPSFLLPTASTSATTSLDTAIEGLPGSASHGRKEEGKFEVGTTGKRDKPNPAAIKDNGPSSTHSSPPQDAAAALSALAAKSPRNPSPKPPSSPSGITFTRVSGHNRDPSDSSLHKASSIHSTSSNAPTLVRRDGKGVSFMPSSPHAASAFEHGADYGVGSSVVAERPSLGRSASGAAREIVELGEGKSKGKLKKKKDVKGKNSEASLKTVHHGVETPNVETPNVKEMEDPVTAKEVEDMVQAGKIEVGKDPVEAEYQPVTFVGEDEAEDVETKRDGLKRDAGNEDKEEPKADRALPASAETPTTPKSRIAQVGGKPMPRSPSLVPKKRELDDVPSNDVFTSNEAPSPRPKRRNLLDAPVCCPPEGKDKDKDRDSEDERVLNEVPEDAAGSEHDKSEVGTTKDLIEDKQETEVYIPPYKPRRDHTPKTLTASPSQQDKLAVAVSATITRHSTIPFSSSRRVELRLAWKEPQSWLWLPGRRYIPDWKLEYVAQGHGENKKGFVRRVVKGSIGWIPVVGRLANWI